MTKPQLKKLRRTLLKEINIMYKSAMRLYKELGKAYEGME